MPPDERRSPSSRGILTSSRSLSILIGSFSSPAVAHAGRYRPPGADRNRANRHDRRARCSRPTSRFPTSPWRRRWSRTRIRCTAATASTPWSTRSTAPSPPTASPCCGSTSGASARRKGTHDGGDAERLDVAAALERSPGRAGHRGRRAARRWWATRSVRWSRRTVATRASRVGRRRPPLAGAGARPSPHRPAAEAGARARARPVLPPDAAGQAHVELGVDAGRGDRRWPTTSSSGARPTSCEAAVAFVSARGRTVMPPPRRARPWPRRRCARRSGRSTRRAPRRRRPRAMPSTRWSSVPTPPLAITGTSTASPIARVSSRSKPSWCRRGPSRSAGSRRRPSAVASCAHSTASSPSACGRRG